MEFKPPALKQTPGDPPVVTGKSPFDLIVRHEGGRTSTYTFDKDEVTIGRNERMDVQIMDRKISRLHAVVRRVGSEFRVDDLGSNNGTFVNGTRVEKAPLVVGDALQIGRAILQISPAGVAVARTTPPIREGREARRTAVTTESEPVSSAVTQMDIPEVGTPMRAQFETAPTTDSFRKLGRFGVGSDKDEQVEARARNYGLVLQISKRLEHAEDFEDLVHWVLGLLMNTLGADGACLALVDSGTGEIISGVSRYRREGLDTFGHPISSSVTRIALSGRQPVICLDMQKDPRFRVQNSIRNLGLRSVLCVPMMGARGPAGVLELVRLDSNDPFDQEALDMATIVGALVGSRLARLRQRAGRTVMSIDE
jgi:pSer/pThr/pTyr-binding forkhead associated (FHA) protein